MLVSADDFRELVADARKERFGARPGRAVMSRRRWRMNPYFHSSTVLEARREGRGDFLVTKTALYFSLPRLWLFSCLIATVVVSCGHKSFQPDFGL